MHCFSHCAAVDAGGNDLLAEINKRSEAFAKLSPDHDALAVALFGASENPRIDGDGRMTISDMIRDHTGLTDQVTFVGMNYKFQIWEPEKFREYRAEAQKRALAMLSGQPPHPLRESRYDGARRQRCCFCRWRTRAPCAGSPERRCWSGWTRSRAR